MKRRGERFIVATRLHWRGAVLIFLLALLVTSTLSLGAFALYASNLQAKTNRAGILVVFDNGKVGQRCVEFNQDEITGIELLEQSGYDISIDASYALGVAVCKIGRDGCNFPNKPCFCECQGASCKYWSYWHWNGSAWIYANMGASNRTIRNGDIDGWVYGIGTTASAQPPPNLTFEQVCAAENATETPTLTKPAPTATDVPPTQTTIPPTATTMPPTETLPPTVSATAPQTETAMPTATLTARAVAPTQTRAPSTQKSKQALAPTATLEWLATETALPTIAADLQATNTPRSKITSTRVPRTTTRVAIASSHSANATRAAQEAQIANEQSSINPRVISVAALIGGIFVVGVGGIVLLGGAAWYFLRGRG